MQWEEFLGDHDLNAEKEYHRPPDGEYLFRKVVHDVRECLNLYRAEMEIAATLTNDIPAITFRVLNEWNNVVERWLAGIASVVEQAGKHPPERPEWARMIAAIGDIVEKAPALKAELESLSLPDEETAKQVVQIAKRQATKLDLLWCDIRAQDYKRLWTVFRYGDLIESN
jgi:hypothetical protein